MSDMSYYFEKRSDKGTNSLFVARMCLGILELRDLIIMTNNDPRNIQVSKEQFDQLYEPIRNSLEIALNASRLLNNICFELVQAGNNGELYKSYPGGGFELINTKSTVIQKEFTSVIEHSSIAIKNHLQKLLEQVFGIKIGFLFQNDSDFEKAINGLDPTNLVSLSNYLQNVRLWSNQLINNIWNQIKHSNWRLDTPKLISTDPPLVRVNLPHVEGIPVNQYAIQVVNRCCILVEDLIVYGIQFYRISLIGIMEIDKDERQYHQNRRFRTYPNSKGTLISGTIFNDEIEII